MEKEELNKRLIALGVKPNFLKPEFGLKTLYDHYSEPHRFYHTWDHIDDFIKRIKNFGIKFTKEEEDVLILAAVFHDVVYDPRASTGKNEADSIDVFLHNFNGSQEISNTVWALISSTINHKPVLGEKYENLCKIFISIDLGIFSESFSEQMEYENRIFKEFQWVDYTIYKEKRVEALEKLEEYAIFPLRPNRFEDLIDYAETRKPKIGVYAGSFNPFHKGHLNILEKAEKIFDKVIIAQGINPQKAGNKVYELPDALRYRQIEQYEGLLTDYLKSKSYDVTLIRGLRNSSDLLHEVNQLRYLEEFYPELKMVSIQCDKDYEHISSSSIRSLESYGKDKHYLI